MLKKGGLKTVLFMFYGMCYGITYSKVSVFEWQQVVKLLLPSTDTSHTLKGHTVGLK